jgi:trans-2,3-dihydro-3-hydroxyanthranilate isomerase
MAREYRYVLLDVFTETMLAGNQLAVFPDAAGMSDAEMQAVARETRLSETTFCLPAETDPRESVRVRIFTTGEELPFAGHPTLGTATALRACMPELHDAPEVRLRLNAGTIPVRFEPGAARHAADGLGFGTAVRGRMDQLLPAFGRQLDPAAVALALGLPAEALDAGKPVQIVSTGTAFALAVLASVEALAGLKVNLDAARQLLGADARFFYVLAPASTDGTRWRARMQFYNGEDPATGSAAGCATAYLVHHGYAPEASPLVIEQGAEIARPSVIESSALLHSTAEGWEPGSYVRVGGSSVVVGEGRLCLP